VYSNSPICCMLDIAAVSTQPSNMYLCRESKQNQLVGQQVGLSIFPKSHNKLHIYHLFSPTLFYPNLQEALLAWFHTALLSDTVSMGWLGQTTLKKLLPSPLKNYPQAEYNTESPCMGIITLKGVFENGKHETIT
jgi:hypothetical protein